MEKNREKTFFWIGTFFLYAAHLVLTVIPKFILEYIPYIYIGSNSYRSCATAFFVLALALYFMSVNTYKSQVVSIILGFLYYGAFVYLIN